MSQINQSAKFVQMQCSEWVLASFLWSDGTFLSKNYFQKWFIIVGERELFQLRSIHFAYLPLGTRLGGPFGLRPLLLQVELFQSFAHQAGRCSKWEFHAIFGEIQMVHRISLSWDMVQRSIDQHLKAKIKSVSCKFKEKIGELTLFWSITSTIATSFPLYRPRLIRPIRPVSTNRLNVWKGNKRSKFKELELLFKRKGHSFEFPSRVWRKVSGFE